MTDKFNHIAPEIIFQNTTTSYKFFWGIALIKLHKYTGRTVYECNEVILRMICEAFFVLNNNKITLGSADHFRASMYSIKKWYPQLSDSANGLFNLLFKDKSQNHVRRIVTYYKENAPFRFLSPWAPKDPYHPYAFDKVPLRDESIMFAASAPYVIYKEFDQWMIKINPQWVELYGHKHDKLIRIVIDCLSTYIAHRNELGKDQYITYLESVIISEETNSAPLIILNTNRPSAQTVTHSVAVAKDKDNAPRPILKASSVENGQKGKEDSVKPSSHSGNVVHNGKLISIGDESLLDKIYPIVESNKLDAVEFLINHFSGHKELNMAFKDWALLVDSIQSFGDGSDHSQEGLASDSRTSKNSVSAPIKRLAQSRVSAPKGSSTITQSISKWDEVDHAIIGIELIYNVFGEHHVFPSFVVNSMLLDDQTITLKLKAWSNKTGKLYLISLLFRNVVYYYASLFLKNGQTYHIACKKEAGSYKYRVGDSNIFINSNKAQVMSIDEI